MKRRLIVEMLDVVQFATPSISNMDISLTARKIVQFKRNSTPRSYNDAFEPIPKIISRHMSLAQLEALLNAHKLVEWRPYLVDVGRRLFDIFSKDMGVWYPVGRKPLPAFANVWTKPAIRGVIVKDGDAYPCLVNPRASVYLGNDKNLAFVGRGVHELHVIDDAQAKGAMIVDLGKHPDTKLRANRVHFPLETELMPLDEFEAILRLFVEAVKLAGFNTNPDSLHTTEDFFRRKS